MKTRIRFVYYSLILLLALMTAISINTAFSNSNKALTDAEMSGTYGGTGSCERKTSNACACDPSSDTGTCYPGGDCDRIYKSSCWQTEYYCEGTNGPGCTDNEPKDCKYTYTLMECLKPQCYMSDPTYPDCKGTKKDASYGYSP